MPRNLVVEVPSIAEPIKRAPGFAKKHLATWKLDLMALCGFGCSYCSSNTGNYLRINRERFADITEDVTGRRLYPATSPELAFTWPDVLEKLDAQLAKHPKSWGAGETLVVSMLTDAFSGPPLRDGTTERALAMLLQRSSFRLRILTKNSAVGLFDFWRGLFYANRDRVVVGLSTGTLDDAWARRVEVGTPPPSARLRATRALQDAGVPTFGMLCPIFPDVLEKLQVERLVREIRPEVCETVWAEPFNDRSNWKAVRAGYDEGSPGWRWFTRVYDGGGSPLLWSRYATDLFLELRRAAQDGGWLHKLKYLLYEGGVTHDDAERFRSLDGVLLQGPTDEQGRSKHPVFARMQGAAP